MKAENLEDQVKAICEELRALKRDTAFERELATHRRVLEFLLNEYGKRKALLSELRRATGGHLFCSGPTYRAADDDLRRALAGCRIQSVRGLSEWLMANEDFGVERGGKERDGMQFKIV